jgi:hypothetical protein
MPQLVTFAAGFLFLALALMPEFRVRMGKAFLLPDSRDAEINRTAVVVLFLLSYACFTSTVGFILATVLVGAALAVRFKT